MTIEEEKIRETLDQIKQIILANMELAITNDVYPY